MGMLSASLTLIFVLIFHSITLSLEIPLGIFSFIFSLAVSRLFDVQIVKATKLITDNLNDHQGLRNFILNHFWQAMKEQWENSSRATYEREAMFQKMEKQLHRNCWGMLRLWNKLLGEKECNV
jgi:hypothetical protein